MRWFSAVAGWVRRLAAALLVFGLLVTPLLVERYRGLGALRRWQAARRAAGEKLSVGELIPGPVATDSTRTLSAAEMRARLAPLAGWGVLPSPMSFVAAGKARAISLADDWGDYPDPRNLRTWQVLSSQLTQLRGALERARSDALDTNLVIAENYRQQTAPPALGAYSGAARHLAASALLALHERRMTEAWQNTVALLFVDRWLQAEPWVVSQSVRANLSNTACDVVWELLQSPGWTEEQLASLQAACVTVSPLESLAATLRLERARADELFDSFRHSLKSLVSFGAPLSTGSGSASNPNSGPMQMIEPLVDSTAKVRSTLYGSLWRFAWSYHDQLLHDQVAQVDIQGALDLANGRSTLAKVRERQRATDPRRLDTFYDRIRYQVSRNFGTFAFSLLSRVVTSQTRREMAMAAVAIERYRLREGRVPDHLESLLPDLLRTLPRDYFDGKPLRYRSTGPADFLLYSVGENCLDEDGNAEAEPGLPTSAQTGRDLVWPRVVSEKEFAAQRRFRR